MSYTINELEMIQDFMIRHNDEIGNNMKSEFETLRRHMTRDLMFTKYISSNLPRIFNSSKAEYKVRTYNGEITIENPIIAILTANENIKVGNIDFNVVKEPRAILLNGNGLEEIECLRAGEDIVFEDMISNPFFKEIAETYKKYTDWKNGKKVDTDSNEIVSIRPAPKPTVEKEVIDSNKVAEAKAELKTSDVNEAFKEIFGEKDENGNYAEFNKYEEDLKKAHNLLGTPSVEDIVEKQVEEAKEKEENKTSLFGCKPFTFGSEDKTDTKPVLKKATKGIKPKFAGFTGTEYMAEDGKVDKNGIPLKFANNTAAEEKFGEPAKDGRTSTNIAELVSPETLKIFTQGTHDATEEELKAINSTEETKPTIFGKPRVEGEYEAPVSSQVVIPNLAHIYFVDEEDMLSGVARDRETEEYIKAHLDELKREGNYIVIENGSMRKLDGSADFSLDEREYLVEQFRNIITDPNVENLGIPKDVLEVMEMEVEDWDNNQNIDNID